MAVHIYMAVKAGKCDEFNYRGEAGINDDPKSFQDLMAEQGFEVILADSPPKSGVSWRKIRRDRIQHAGGES
ncbi:MAG: hypothetical protein AB7Q01_14975 [Gammaproteobacteria bacterium]